MTLLERINADTNGAYADFRLRGMRFDTRTDECTVFVNYALTDGRNPRDFEKEARKYLPTGIRYSFRYARILFNPDDVALRTRNFLAERIHVMTKPDDVSVGDGTVTVTLDTIDYHAARDADISQALTQALDDEFCRRYAVSFVERVSPLDPAALAAELDAYADTLAPAEEAIAEEREIAVTKVEKYIGDLVTGPASYISDCVIDEETKVVLCGRVSEFRAFEKPSSKHPDKLLRMVMFRLTDPTGSIPVFTFSSEANFAKWSALSTDGGVILEGIVAANSYRDEDRELRVTKLSYCELPETFAMPARRIPEPSEYVCVRPKPFVTIRQQDLLTEEERPDPYFFGKTFVVFDTETTGTRHSDRIVEVALVRLVDGVIRESMQTLVDPEMPIHPSATRVNHITDEMVVGAPKWRDVVADVYKFCYGATLVGHNVGFDVDKLNTTSLDTPYRFDNPTEDTLAIAQRKLHDVRNYKLETLIGYFGIENENAHRALSDTVATARLFVKLIGYRPKEA